MIVIEMLSPLAGLRIILAPLKYVPPQKTRMVAAQQARTYV